MDVTAPHAAYVIAAYAISAASLLALLLYVLRRDRIMRKSSNKDD